MKTRSIHLALIILISGLLGYYIGVSKVALDWKNYHPTISVINKEPPPPLQTVDFSLFWTVWQKLESSYYDKKALDPQKLLNGAISGMVSGLEDPYTVFLPPTQNSSFKDGLAGKFEGIGAELGMKGKQIIIVSPLDGSPAQKSGIKASDAIIKVNGQSTLGWTLSQAVEKIRGPKGTEVTLVVMHKGEDNPSTVKIVRDTITVKSVDGWVKQVKDIEKINPSTALRTKEEKIAYIRLSQFGDGTNSEWVTLINSLKSQVKNDKSVKGLILDLRNNPGGYLTDATFVASEFLDSGTVVIQDRGNGDKTIFSVSRKGVFTTAPPVIVLINRGSASASEIVAGALRDHKRAILVGETSFGKGTIQQAEDLGNGAGLHVTIAKWLTPNGIWVHGEGLKPDIAVEVDEKDQEHDLPLEKAVQELLK